ncbi:MAG: murein L,D-transpeptidase catalytic domain family protein [Chitinophagaceae bacterium]|nr:murein L,D-transpeptidase catalytic domain family protein [Chitinophagaceae bacterium]
MNTVVRSFMAFSSLIVSIDAISSVADKPLYGLENGTSFNNKSPVFAPSDTTSDNSVLDTSFYRINTTYKAALIRLKQQAGAVKEYLAENDFNTEYCFLVDMSIPSGKNRFFVYNFKKESLETSSLVAHGFGSTKHNSYDELEFSNMPNSYKTSLGKYKIGNDYKGTYGLSYKLYGLDSTNDRALERTIVLHADTHVPEKEPFPYHIYQSAGCPTVSPLFLSVLTKYIKASKKPILMWIYYS